MEAIYQEYNEIFDELGKQFYVESLLTEQSRMIFVLESPHVQEVKNGVPVAGSSGASMSKHLFGEAYNKPLGLLCKKNVEEQKERPSLNTIGLMNVCGIPMQRKAYQDRRIAAGYSDFFDILEGVRQNNHKPSFQNERWNVMQNVILDRFKNRLRMILDRKCALVPCGRFSQKFFRLADVNSENWKLIQNVPHPSYNSWSRERYRGAIDEVKATFNAIR